MDASSEFKYLSVFLLITNKLLIGYMTIVYLTNILNLLWVFQFWKF